VPWEGKLIERESRLGPEPPCLKDLQRGLRTPPTRACGRWTKWIPAPADPVTVHRPFRRTGRVLAAPFHSPAGSTHQAVVGSTPRPGWRSSRRGGQWGAEAEVVALDSAWDFRICDSSYSLREARGSASWNLQVCFGDWENVMQLPIGQRPLRRAGWGITPADAPAGWVVGDWVESALFQAIRGVR
jgi:hypothetical protein